MNNFYFMFKKANFIIYLFCFFNSYSQDLFYKSNGNIFDSEQNRIPPEKVRELLANNEKLLAEYNSGRTKKTAGNILFIGGFTLLATDLLIAVYTPYDINEPDKKVYPSALTYIGITSVLVSIPIKIGFSKKIKQVVIDYNNQKSIGFKQINYNKIELITNSNGLGFRFTLN